MELAAVSPALKFHTALETIRKDHPYQEEIAWMDRKDDASKLLKQIESLDGKQLKEYATSLPNSNLELVFHALKDEVTQSQKEKLFFILSMRMKKRLFNYNWILLQEHYTNTYLKESFDIITRYMKEKVPTKYKLTLASKLSIQADNPVEQALTILKSEGGILSEFFDRYNIMKNSSFGKAIFKEFFLHCDKVGFQDNTKLFLEEIQDKKELYYPQINHYLSVMNITEYVEDINNYLSNIYTDQKNNVIWNNIQKELKVKFLGWMKLKELGEYMGIHSEKFQFWRNYYNEIEKTKLYPALNLFLIYLPGYVVIDPIDEKDVSYLYKRAAFNVIFRKLENEASWSLYSDAVVNIKDAILENKRSEIYELNYEGLGKLYIRDYLDMIL